MGFHSWGGGTPEQYAAWGDLAEWLGLPLLVTELGVDAAAWRGRTYDSFHYGLREVRMYQELLLDARPQGTMQWEFTAFAGEREGRRVYTLHLANLGVGREVTIQGLPEDGRPLRAVRTSERDLW